MLMKWLRLAVFLFAFGFVKPSPVLLPPDLDNFAIRLDDCDLPSKLGKYGSMEFVEDCYNLDMFPSLPMPVFHKYGTHPLICCPRLSETSICFSTDPWCPNYVKPPVQTPSQTDIDQENYEDYEVITEPPKPILLEKNIPKISDEDCRRVSQEFGNSTQCVNLKDCPGIFKPPYNTRPTDSFLCGWDDEDKALKICCPNVSGVEIQDRSLRKVVEPRFPGYQCNDKVNQCQFWKNNGGCRTDTHFVIDPDDEYNGKAFSPIMFDFMSGTCMETCGYCGDKNCRDEHPDCQEWARQALCVFNPRFMTHTCRESCGVCGFLSTHDTTEQIVGDNTYSDFRNPSFDCGRYKKLSEINIENIDEGKIKGRNIRSVDDVQTNIISGEDDQSEDEGEDVFFSNEGEDKFCGSTRITDKWIVTAAHCHDNFGISSGVLNTFRDQTLFKEDIESKRIFKHPKYAYPELYNDIALIQLGRRQIYDWDKYGDTPMCIDRIGNNDGKLVTMQGTGQTENGTHGDELEGNATVISNSHCKETLNHNLTKSAYKTTIEARIDRSMPEGLNGRMFCTQGAVTDDGLLGGACKGDSGGPIFFQEDNGRQKLIGIVSGGIGCGQGYPNWHTKVAFFTPWIECIIESSKIFKNNKRKIEKKCNEVAEATNTSALEEDDYDY